MKGKKKFEHNASRYSIVFHNRIGLGKIIDLLLILKNQIDMKLRFITLSVCMLVCSLAFSQFSPVNWSYSAEKVNAKEYKIMFTAEIESGWYVYSQFLEDGGPIATSFTFTNDGLETLGTAEEESNYKKENFDELFGMKLIKYAEKVTFVQKVKITDDLKTAKGYLTFMTCNDESCLPPKDVEFEIELN